jgi:hypothetical protein
MSISKINLRIEQDWAPVIQKFDRVKNLLISYPTEKAKWIDGYKGFRYDFGQSGSFLFFDSITEHKKTAGALSGLMLENVLPWLSQLKIDFAELNLASAGIQGSVGKLLKHRDGQELIETKKHCKLNYIIDDYTDITYVENDNNNISEYPSIKNTAWLIDTTKNHWVENNTGPRYIFQLTFHQAYNEVAEWLSNKEALIYK